MKLFELFDFTHCAEDVGFFAILREDANVGMTTPLVSQPANQPGGAGFITREDREMIKVNGDVVKVKAGTKLYITKPGTLFTGQEIGGPRAKGVYVLVGLRSPLARYATGYMALSNIANPANAHARVHHGSEAQERFVEWMEEKYGERFKLQSVAPRSSQAPDVIATVDGTHLQFEIKGQGETQHFTFIDRMVRRDQPDPILDSVARALSGDDSFTGLIDRYRKTNPAVGFPGDEGAPPSGKVPPEFRLNQDPQVLDQVRTYLHQTFKQAGDNYLAVVQQPGPVTLYWTGVGKNVLKAPPLPTVNAVTLATYGGAYKNAMRVALKVFLDR